MRLFRIWMLIVVFIVNLLGKSMAEQFFHLKMNKTTTTQTILRDIQNAFKTVTNNTGVLKNVIPVMYDLTRNQENLTFVFKIPNSGVGYSTIWIQRSDFVEPSFPNLTKKYMEMMKQRRRSVHKIISNTATNSTDPSGRQYGGKDDWGFLGLDGWTGQISQPFEVLQTTHHNDLKVNNADDKYPSEEILIDFYEKIEEGINVTTAASGKLSNANAIKERQLADNIYIARVNDPFGYSTKWKLRNETSTTPFTNFTKEDRLKRDVIELYSMIRCSTGCEPLTYKGYGCYCGFLGAGVPVNGIDRCCKQHDKCYEQSNCISYLEYFVPYLWKCYRGKPLCAIDHGEWGGPRSCAARLCSCDLRLSRCLRKYSCPRRKAVCTSSTARQLQNLLFFK